MLASPNQDFGNHETIHKRASGKFRPATNLPDSGRMVGNSEAIQKLSSRKVTLCWRFGAAEGAAGGNVSAFRGR